MSEYSEDAMTRPTLPGLVARWTQPSRLGRDGLSHYAQGYGDAQRDCAAELSQAVALTFKEEGVLADLDWRRANEGKKTLTMLADDYDTLRALVTRLTAASDGGGKGEAK